MVSTGVATPESFGLDNPETLADELIASGFPVILASGYGSDQLPNRFADTPKLRKPFSADELASVLKRILQQGSSPTSG